MAGALKNAAQALARRRIIIDDEQRGRAEV
jgi:hypothetical protein